MWYTALEDRKHGGKEDQEDVDHSEGSGQDTLFKLQGLNFDKTLDLVLIGA